MQSKTIIEERLEPRFIETIIEEPLKTKRDSGLFRFIERMSQAEIYRGNNGQNQELYMTLNKDLHIAISGKSGCGNTTVSGLLAKKLGIKLINYTFRQLAAEKGMTLAEVIEAAKNDDSYDKYVDSHQVELAQAEPSVLGSRLAIWVMEKADLKVYLYASDETRAQRVFNREGGDLQQIKDFTAMRDREDTGRYKAFYGIDNNNYDFVDLIIDTANYNPEQIVDLILNKLEEKGLITK